MSMECGKDISDQTYKGMSRTIIFMLVVLMVGCKPSIYLQKNAIQLSKPKLLFDNVFFEESTIVKISPTVKKAKLFYSISDGKMKRYKEPIRINKSTKIVAQARSGGYLPSDSSEIELVKLPKNEIISIKSERALNEKYGESGLDILIDRNKGTSDFNNGWLGYAGGKIVFDLDFDIIDVDHIIISTLRNQDAWIFSPKQINIYSDGNRIGEMSIDDSADKANNSSIFTKINLTKTNIRKLTLEIIAPENIPSWHPGAGTKPWIFIDEILIY